MTDGGTELPDLAGRLSRTPFVRIGAMMAGVATVVAAGCGGSSRDASRACARLPHPRSSHPFLVLFGSLTKLSERQVCMTLRNPQRITLDSRACQVWDYRAAKLTIDHGRVVSAQPAGSQPVGG